MKSMKHEISPDEYEQAFSEKLLYEFPPPVFRVVWDDRSLIGRYSKVARQLDVAVYRADESHPFLVAEARRWSRSISVEVVDCFIGKLDDIGPETKAALLVALKGFSEGAMRRATASETKLLIVSADEALEMNLRPIARQIYPWDWAFHPELARALLSLQRNDDPEKIVQKIERIAYEEWLSFVQYGLENHPSEAIDFLRFIALNHPDDGWRFNAVQQLIHSSVLSQVDVERILAQEHDPEIIELLMGCGFPLA